MGPGNDTIKRQQDITQSEINVSNQQQQIAANQQSNANVDRDKMTAFQQPLIQKETALAAGDSKAALAASMPVISKLSAGYQGAKENIMNSLPPGPARDAALANLEVTKASGIGGAQADAVNRAPEILANLGSSEGAFSLQELGAALSGFGGGVNSLNAAGSSNAQVGKMQTDQSNAFWQPLISLASLAGNLAVPGSGSIFSSVFQPKGGSKPMTWGGGSGWNTDPNSQGG